MLFKGDKMNNKYLRCYMNWINKEATISNGKRLLEIVFVGLLAVLEEEFNLKIHNKKYILTEAIGLAFMLKMKKRIDESKFRNVVNRLYKNLIEHGHADVEGSDGFQLNDAIDYDKLEIKKERKKRNTDRYRSINRSCELKDIDFSKIGKYRKYFYRDTQVKLLKLLGHKMIQRKYIFS